MALGAIVATSLFAAPAALAGTFIAAKKGQEAFTAATKYSAEVQEYCAKVQVAYVGLTAIEGRIQETSDLPSRWWCACVARLPSAKPTKPS